LRYWDGTAWTEHVSDAGATGQDPVWRPPAPAHAGLGLASARLRYLRGDDTLPWPVLDGDAVVAGWVMPPGRVRIGAQEVPVLDAWHRAAVRVRQSMGGTRVMGEQTELGRIRFTGFGGLSKVEAALEAPGSGPLHVHTHAAEMHREPAAVVDGGGTPVATLGLAWTGDGGIELVLTRLVTLPATQDPLLLALPVAVALELDNRAAFRLADSDVGTFGDHDGQSHGWPGL
jgi:hypothetical protein